MISRGNRTSRCAAKNGRGDPCGMAPLDGATLCFVHDPRRGRDRAEARKRGGRNRRTPNGSSAGPVSLRDVASVQALLESTVSDTLVQANSSQRSRTLGYLLGVALKALEVGEMEQRIMDLERHLAA